MDVADPDNPPPQGTFIEGAEFKLVPGPKEHEYTVADVIGVPRAWLDPPCILRDNRRKFLRAMKPLTLKFSPLTKQIFLADYRRFVGQINEKTRYLEGEIVVGTSEKVRSRVRLVQVPGQIEDDEDLLIILIQGPQTNAGGGIIGHS